MPNPKEKVDHVAEARRWVNAADRQASNGVSEIGANYAALGQVHASLAIAEQLERLNGNLEEVIDPGAGASFPGVVRVRTEGAEG